MNTITNVSKNKATLNGRVVRIRPVTQKSMRAGKFYLRFFLGCSAQAGYEILKIHGQSFRADKCLRAPAMNGSYRGKQKVSATYYGHHHTFYAEMNLNPIRRRESFMADMGIDGLGNPILYEYDHNTRSLFEALSEPGFREQSCRLLGLLKS